MLKNLLSGFVGMLLVACVGQGVFIYYAHFLPESPKTHPPTDLASTFLEAFKNDAFSVAQSTQSPAPQSQMIWREQGQPALSLPGFHQLSTVAEMQNAKGQENGSVHFKNNLASNQSFPMVAQVAGLDLAPPQNLPLSGPPGTAHCQLTVVESAQTLPVGVVPMIQPPLPNGSTPVELGLPGLPQPREINQANDLVPPLGPSPYEVPTPNNGGPLHPQTNTPQLITWPMGIPSGIAQFVQIQQQLAQHMSPEELKKATDVARRQLEDRKKQKVKEEKEQNALTALENARKALKQVSHDFPDTEAGKKANQYLKTLENKAQNITEQPPALGDQIFPPLQDQTEPPIPPIGDPLLIPNGSNPLPKK